jgi:hypothetical protein
MNPAIRTAFDECVQKLIECAGLRHHARALAILKDDDFTWVQTPYDMDPWEIAEWIANENRCAEGVAASWWLKLTVPQRRELAHELELAWRARV